jgi:hypothetical protein
VPHWRLAHIVTQRSIEIVARRKVPYGSAAVDDATIGNNTALAPDMSCSIVMVAGR